MINGLAITVPVIGRIAIGYAEEGKNGKRIPKKDDQFTITRQYQNNGAWELHPLHKVCMDKQSERFAQAKADALREKGCTKEEIDKAVAKMRANDKLREIPVRLLFDDPDLNFRAEFASFDRKGHQLCCGDGKTHTRRTDGSLATGPCPGPDTCTYNTQEHPCKPYGRMHVQIEGQNDELGAFIFRTTGWNSIRTLTARIRAIRALTQGKLAGIPLALKLEAKSTAQSFHTAIFYADLRIRDGMKLVDAFKSCIEFRKEWDEGGLDRASFEEATRLGLSTSAFEETVEDGVLVMEEFYPETEAPEPVRPAASPSPVPAQLASIAQSGTSNVVNAFHETLRLHSLPVLGTASDAGDNLQEPDDGSSIQIDVGAGNGLMAAAGG